MVVHGDHVLVRRTALERRAAGQAIHCEDTDLGSPIWELGWIAHYTNRRYGYGCCPIHSRPTKSSAIAGPPADSRSSETLAPFSRQRATHHREKREFAMGWLNWLGADSVGSRCRDPEYPMSDRRVRRRPQFDKVLTLPIIAASWCRLPISRCSIVGASPFRSDKYGRDAGAFDAAYGRARVGSAHHHRTPGRLYRTARAAARARSVCAFAAFH